MANNFPKISRNKTDRIIRVLVLVNHPCTPFNNSQMTSQISSDAFFNQLVNDLCIELSFRAFQKQMTINSVCPHCNQHCENIRMR